MIDELLQNRRRKHTKDLNIVPILDMLVTVIFFLLMSTSFIEFTKLTLPPASTVSAPNDSKVPPVAPRAVVLNRQPTGYTVVLSWSGRSPGQNSVQADDQNIVQQVQTLLKGFSERYPKEKTLSVSMGKTVRYQALISFMDGAKEVMPDMVLTSYEGAEK